MAQLQILGLPASNFVWVARIACAEKGVPYELVQARPHTPEIDAIHPFGKMPAMRHGDVTLCESRAICSYIDRLFDGPPLLPRDPVLATRIEQWISIVCTHLDPLWIRQYFAGYVFPGTPDGSPDRARIEAALPQMAGQFATMNEAVASGHLAGNAFSLADAYLTPILFYMNRLPESRALLDRAPRLNAYFERHLARPSVAKAVPPSPPGPAPR